MLFGSEDRDPDNWFQRFAVDFKMNNPVWYDPVPTVTLARNPAWLGGNGMQVPTPVPFGVSGSRLDGSVVIPYSGTWETFPTLRIQGPIVDPSLTHLQLGSVLSFKGALGPSDYWDIMLAASPKVMVDQNGVSILRYLNDPNDFNTFRLAPDPDVLNGSNTILFTGRQATGTTSLTVTYYNRYIGI
jgi:hypothetical protein